jgi:hypothetical protein
MKECLEGKMPFADRKEAQVGALDASGASLNAVSNLAMSMGDNRRAD